MAFRLAMTFGILLATIGKKVGQGMVFSLGLPPFTGDYVIIDKPMPAHGISS